MVSSRSRAWANGAITRSTSVSRCGDRALQLLQVLQGQPRSSSAWWSPNRPRSAWRSCGDLVAQPALGQLGEHLGVALAGDQGGEHRPTRHAQHVGGDRVQLDAGILQGLLDPLALRGMGLDQPLAVAGQVPQLPDRGRGHEAAPQQPVLEQLGQPLGVQTSLLRPGRILTWWALTSFSSKPALLQHVPDRLPVRAGGLHHHLGDALGGQPVGHRLQPRGEGRERPGLLGRPARPSGSAHAGHHLVLADVHPGAALTSRSTVAPSPWLVG